MTRTVLLAVLFAVLPACGGGAGGGSTPPLGSFQIVRIVPQPLEDGWMDNNNSGRLNNNVGVGDEENIQGTDPSRLFYRFRLDSLPAGTVSSVVLQLHQARVDGNPYQSLGRLQVVRVDFGADLDPSDYNAAAMGVPVDVSTDASIGSREVDVTAEVKAAIAAGRSVVDLRVQWSAAEADLDGAADIVYLTFVEDFENTGNVPGLFVRVDQP